MAKTKLTKKASLTFDEIKRVTSTGVEYWSSRDLAKCLQYADYRNFMGVIAKAKEACRNSQVAENQHFVDVNEMLPLANGAERQVITTMMTRYACYLSVQNADPSKTIVAQAQTYFAIKTREAELNAPEKLTKEEENRLLLRGEMTKHNTRLASAAKDAGVIDSRDFAIFQNFGYKGLYGGLSAQDIHKRKGLKKSQHILDHMGSTELAANLFRATQTEEKLRRDGIIGKNAANKTHLEVGKKVRETIKELGGTMPENLPTTESIKKLEKKNKRIKEIENDSKN